MASEAITSGSDRLDALMDSHPLPSWRIFAWPVMVFMVAAVTWAFFSELDEVAVADGEVVPLGKVKVIQHLEGGIIEQLFVAEGDTIKTGDPLVQLDLASTGANLEELQVRLDSQQLVRSRLVAESEGLETLDFPEDAASRRPVLVDAQRQAFTARKRELNSTMRVLDEQVKQKEAETKEIEARRKAVGRNFKLAKERLQMSKSLLAEGLTAKMEHLELEAEVEELEGEMKSLDPQLPKKRAAVEEVRQRLEEEKDRFSRQAQEELGEVEQDIARLREQLDQAAEKGSRAEIKSPIDGVVKNLRYNTIGGVVRPGEPILEIVPTGGKLVIESKIDPTERGFITVGLPAVVKISSYDFARYGGLDGEVVRVSADASTEEDGTPYFLVVVQTEKNFLGSQAGQLPITPGMQATVDIHTGKKSVIDYLVKPVLKLRDEAFRER